MKTIYTSKHGHSKKVAQRFGLCYDSSTFPSLDEDITLFICPTYGDEELPPAMENFLCSITCTKKLFVICELGNYYGYDDFRFGALKIIDAHLKSLGWNEFFPALSLDSMPSIDWTTFENWKRELCHALQTMEK